MMLVKASILWRSLRPATLNTTQLKKNDFTLIIPKQAKQ